MTHWATPFIGRPWQYGARGPDTFDCWGFVQFIQRTHYRVELPDVLVPESWSETRRLLEGHEEHRNWIKVLDPQDGDVVMMARSRVPVHIGVIVEAGCRLGVLHCFEPSGVVYQPISTLRVSGWGGLSYYRRIHG